MPFMNYKKALAPRTLTSLHSCNKEGIMNVKQGLGLHHLLGLTQLLNRHLNCFCQVTDSVKIKEKRQASKTVYHFLDTHLLSCEEHRSWVSAPASSPPHQHSHYDQYISETITDTFSRKVLYTILIFPICNLLKT